MDSTDRRDVWAENIIQTYEKRPKEYENLCLADYFSQYSARRRFQDVDRADFNCEDQNGEEEAIDSRWTLITLNCTLVLRKCESTTTVYNREMVLTFYPFRDEELYLSSRLTWNYTRFMKMNC